GDFSRLTEMDAVMISVPTPLDQRREPDLSYVEQTAHSIQPHLQRGQLIVLESTTYPGTTEELVLPILEQSGLHCPIANGSDAEDIATDFFLAFSPEREDPGNKQYGLAQIPKVVGGVNPPSGLAAVSLYAQIVARVVPVSTTRAAEMAKLLENIFRCVNIALVNELKQLSLRMGMDIWEVIDAAATKPFGFMPFYPGPGLGGHCIPIDPYYLSWKAREYDFATRFIELAGEVNTAMPYNVVEAVASALNDHKKSIKGAKVLVLGVAYKKDVDDLRESPTLKIMQLLQQRGAHLDYNDPYFPQLQESARVKQAFSDQLIERIAQFAEKSAACLRTGGKIVFFGNGGSAADAQHLAAELVVKLSAERRGLAALALTTNSSVLTAAG